MAIVAEMDPTTQAVTYHPGSRLHTAVVKAAEALQARLFMPQLGERMLKAMDLVLTGNVTAQDDAASTVQSGNHTYQVDPEAGCPCKFAAHQSKWCKHAVAVELHRQAHRLLATGNGTAPEPEASEASASVPPHPEASQPPPVQALPEAPASTCMRWEDHGISMQLTLRDHDDAALFARVKAVLPRIKATVAQQQQADIEAAEAGTIPAEQWCTRHQVLMQRYEKGTRVWHSHKLTDGSWCNGRQ